MLSCLSMRVGGEPLQLTAAQVDSDLRVGQGQRVFEAMQTLGVIVRPMGGYALPEWIRISVGTPDENERCLRTLKQVVKSAKGTA